MRWGRWKRVSGRFGASVSRFLSVGRSGKISGKSGGDGGVVFEKLK